jgi:hypothetical protein
MEYITMEFCEVCGAELTTKDWPYGYRIITYLCNRCKYRAAAALEKGGTHETV